MPLPSLTLPNTHAPQGRLDLRLQAVAQVAATIFRRLSSSLIFTLTEHGNIQSIWAAVAAGLARTLHAAGLLQSCQAGSQAVILLVLLHAGRILLCRQLLCGCRAHLS